MNTIKLQRIGNNILPQNAHPVGMKKYSQYHKKLLESYSKLVGTEPVPSDYKDCSDFIIAFQNFGTKFAKLRNMNLWAGANITEEVGKHKVPRFLYHITTVENYQKMLQDGVLRVSNGIQSAKGLFMFELQNMIKYYQDIFGNKNFSALFEQVMANGSDNAVLLRIPTSKLDMRKLAIHPQYGVSQKTLAVEALGDSAINSKLYKQRKTALEYVYPVEIPIANVSKVGTAQMSVEDNAAALQVWQKLTQNQPEQRAFDFVKIL